MTNSVEGNIFIMCVEKINYTKKNDKVKKSIHAHITLIETLYEQLKKTQSKIFFLKENFQRFYRQFSLILAGEKLIVSGKKV